MNENLVERKYVDAAVAAFADKGFFGTTMNDIADAAGVSQPRISQVFDGKESAFLLAHAEARAITLEGLQGVASKPFDPARIGSAVLTLLQKNRPAMLLVLHAATASSVPAIGAECRAVIGSIITLLIEECGATPSEARDFLATGFLSMVLASTEVFDHLDEHPGLGQLARGMSELGSPAARHPGGRS
ncbi:MAG: TetR/AcrR family transcriptional regulator [Propionibacteriales bacterium]|nr:TetR/AcrR family transcriptional regulator [Propionibacteriales bacterium]